MSKLANALFTTTQQKILGLLYSQDNRSFYFKEIIRLTNMGIATIKRELTRMLEAEILTMIKIGNQHHYQANKNCPIFYELKSIVSKTFGISDIIKSSLTCLSDRIDKVFIFGSVASGKESSQSDIDLMVIGDISFAELSKNLYQAQELIGKEINPKVFSEIEWQKLNALNDSFIQSINSNPKIEIIL